MSDTLSALTVSRFLQANPDFFTSHAELFAALTVPHPNQARAISLGERQIMTLRDRQKDLEMRLAVLSRQAHFNESVANKLTEWCQILVAAEDAQSIPGHIIAGLTEIFELSDVSMRLWGLGIAAQGVGEPVDDEVRQFALDLPKPYCGPNKEFSVTHWLQQQPASLAMIPIHHGTADQAACVGLLLLGSDDAERFTSDMGTTFLETIARLSSAAIGRLPAAPSV